MGLFKSFFIGLSNSTALNELARKFGPSLGANKVVAGETIESVIETIKELNQKNISVSVDSLGEFVNTKAGTIESKNKIIEVIHAIHEHNVDAHISLKISQLGSEFDKELAYENLREILLEAHKCGNIHINIDTEKFASLHHILETLDRLRGEFKNVGTVIQTYLYDAEAIADKYPDLRLRIVKGAYKELPSIAYQTKEEIDQNYIRIIEKRLLTATNLTSIATHDHDIINHVKQFAKDNNVNKDHFEFQMLYGFRSELAESIAREGYNFTIYVPYGDDWFAYFMRRLAERPQNINLAFKEFVTPKTLTVVGSAVAGAVAVGGLIAGVASLIGKNKKKDNKDEQLHKYEGYNKSNQAHEQVNGELFVTPDFDNNQKSS
ncbi:proline dehydrogenase [Staphylococcus massiliensis]|uniref:proline dehydrogenase family protein n=1 Tax=Staphylococcus massiliensis TaxID=555791 RepID=UPI001EE04858|nr:proline dehydrogenase [Staphylococcus massiliensis]MCG3400800.1 proline dehydrogenase [Staphylococcus massiliensis]